MTENEKLKHSVVGNVSFAVGVLTIALSFIFWGEMGEMSPPLILISTIGVSLGVSGSLKPNKKKIFSILGLVINTLMLLLYWWLFICL